MENIYNSLVDIYQWGITHKSLLLNIFFVIERIANETPPSLRIFGVPVGKYDNEILKAIRALVRIVIKVFYKRV